jgi:hypothetical protein
MINKKKKKKKNHLDDINQWLPGGTNTSPSTPSRASASRGKNTRSATDAPATNNRMQRASGLKEARIHTYPSSRKHTGKKSPAESNGIDSK